MTVGSDNFREAFLALVTIGPGLALALYIFGHFIEWRAEQERQRDECEQDLRQRARAFRQSKQRLRARRGN